MHLNEIISYEKLQFLYEGYCEMPLLWEGIFSDLLQFESPLQSNHVVTDLQIKQHKRLGKLAEDLFSNWIKQNQRFNVVFENLQIIEDKRTLGEIDVMLFDTELQKYIHLELVTKFYVYNPAYAASDIRAWIGPNRNDSLLEKVTKLKEKQLPLLHQKFTQQVLQDFIPKAEVIHQQVLFKAYLFVPLKSNINTGVLNTECIAGNYVTLTQFNSLHITAKRYHCPIKQDWLRHPKTQNSWKDIAEVLPQIAAFMDAAQSLMVWVKYNETYQRYIVVPYQHF